MTINDLYELNTNPCIHIAPAADYRVSVVDYETNGRLVSDIITEVELSRWSASYARQYLDEITTQIDEYYCDCCGELLETCECEYDADIPNT